MFLCFIVARKYAHENIANQANQAEGFLQRNCIFANVYDQCIYLSDNLVVNTNYIMFK